MSLYLVMIIIFFHLMVLSPFGVWEGHLVQRSTEEVTNDLMMRILSVAFLKSKSFGPPMSAG
jgi:hypothetical protein